MKTKFSLSIFTLMTLYSLSAQINLGDMDDFENGTTQNWIDGGSSVPPVNIASGGPNGASDNYLSDPSLGGNGEGSKMVMFNEQQWAGNYTNEGIFVIRFHARALTNNLNLRVAFDGAGGRICTINAVSIPAGGNWQVYEIPISASDFTTVAGGSNISQTLADVNDMRILSNTVPSWQGESIVATLEIDNIEAAATLGLDDLDTREVFKIIPSIAQNTINVIINDFYLDTHSSIKIYDITGKLILEKMISNSNVAISVSDWNNGIYMAQINTKNSQQVKRFIKN